MLDGYKRMELSVNVKMRNQERKKGEKVKKLEAANDRLLYEFEKEKENKRTRRKRKKMRPRRMRR